MFCCVVAQIRYCWRQKKWAMAWQNQQNDLCASEDSDQSGHPPCLISLRCPHKEALDPWLPYSAQRRLIRPDWVDAKGCRDHFVGFATLRLINLQNRLQMKQFYQIMFPSMSFWNCRKIKHKDMRSQFYLESALLYMNHVSSVFLESIASDWSFIIGNLKECIYVQPASHKCIHHIGKLCVPC